MARHSKKASLPHWKDRVASGGVIDELFLVRGRFRKIVSRG
jgi:hypothetical protein